MALYARIRANDGTKILVHRFGAALREWASGGITRQQVIDAFQLTGSDVTELDALQATYTSLPSNNVAAAIGRAQFLDRMEDVFMLIETGDYTEAFAKSRLGF